MKLMFSDICSKYCYRLAGAAGLLVGVPFMIQRLVGLTSKGAYLNLCKGIFNNYINRDLILYI